MTTAACPGCGAPLQFRWSGAIQTTCEYCRSILVRQDVDITRVGEVADIPDDASPIQIGTAGVYRGKAFEVIGRIVYEYAQGTWNEWHIVFNDSTSGWLSDAMLEYAISFLYKPEQPVPDPASLAPGWTAIWKEKRYGVTSITTANYVGVEGELPFVYWDKKQAVFGDLRTTDGGFATIDGTEHPPFVFLGEFMDFDHLHLSGLRTIEGWS